MKSFSVRLPQEVHFGCGSLKLLNGWLKNGKFRRVVFCLSRTVSVGAFGEELLRQFEVEGLDVLTLSDMESEAPLPAVQRWIDAARAFHADGVVAAGGGTVLDAAKSVAAVAPLTFGVSDIFDGAAIPGKGLPFAALPTTAGTGSEFTANAVLLNPRTGEKKSIRHPSMLPDAVFNDPELTLGTPEYVTLCSGMDALVQGIESLCSKGATPFTKLQAREGVRLILKYLPSALCYGDCSATRERLALGSFFSAMAFPLSGLGAVHALAHPLGARLKRPHGEVCAVLLLPILRFNAPAVIRPLSELADFCTIPHGADGMFRTLEKFCSELKIPEKYPQITDEDIAFTVGHCRSNSMNYNPLPMRDDEVRTLLESLRS